MSPARSYDHPDTEDITMPRVLFALSDPLRLGMIHHLAAADGEVDSRELGPDLPKSTLTHHTRLLRESGLTWTRGVGRQCLIRLRTVDLDARFPGLLGTVLAGWHPEQVDGGEE